MRCRVLHGYVREFEVAPRARTGEVVTFEKFDPKNPAWFYGRDGGQVAGYFPVAWFDLDGTAARARRDYDALELTAPAGAVVTVIERYGQWALVEGGTRGWIPEENLEGLT